MHDVTGKGSCLVGKEILHLEKTGRQQVIDCVCEGNVGSFLVSIIDNEAELTWPSSSLRLDVRAMAGVSVSE